MAWGLGPFRFTRAAGSSGRQHRGTRRKSTLLAVLAVAALFGAGPGFATAAGPPSFFAPGPPGLRVISSSATGATLFLSRPIDSYEKPVAFYTITGEPGDISVQTQQGDTLVTGLSVGTTYRFTATAVSAQYGPGYPSDPVTVTPAANPNPPGRPVMTTHPASPGDGSIHLAWRPPADDGGSPITSYTVKWLIPPVWPDDPPPYQSATLPASQLDYDITGLADQTWYEVDVLASNAAGDSPLFGDDFEVIFTPQPPTGLQLAAAGPNQLHMSWSAPTSGTPIVSYLVTATDPAGGSPPISVTATDTQATLDVTNDISYQVQVYAVDGSNASSPPATGQSPATHANVPDAPTLALVSHGSGQVRLQLTGPANNGGAPVTGYTIIDNARGISQPATAGINTVSGLRNGTAYTFIAVAANSQGPSTSSTAVTVTPAGVPGPPRLLAKSGWYTLNVVLTAPPTDGGSTVTRYTVTLTRPGMPTKTLTRTVAGTVTFIGLTPLTAYTVRAAAQNAIGASATAVVPVRTTALPAVTPIPATRVTLVPGVSVSLSGAGLFGAGSTVLTPAARNQLALLARDLVAAKAIRCEGYSDFGGDPVANYWVALARAVAVCNTLKADGVKAAMSIVSYGGTRPATTGTNRALNRRVIVFVER